MEHDYPATLWIISSVIILLVIGFGYMALRKSRRRMLGDRHNNVIARAAEARPQTTPRPPAGGDPAIRRETPR